MAQYKIRALYTISLERIVEAESEEEALDMVYDINIQTEYNGNSVFVDDDTVLEADGEIRDITIEKL